MKLQKLVYFAQGAHLAKYNSPLSMKHLQAWMYGPVIPEIYQISNFREAGPLSITAEFAPSPSYTPLLASMPMPSIP